jgi:hypothetical protein
MFWSLFLRITIIIALTDAAILGVIKWRKQPITWVLIVEIIVITLIPMYLSLWFDFYRYKPTFAP